MAYIEITKFDDSFQDGNQNHHMESLLSYPKFDGLWWFINVHQHFPMKVAVYVVYPYMYPIFKHTHVGSFGWRIYGYLWYTTIWALGAGVEICMTHTLSISIDYRIMFLAITYWMYDSHRKWFVRRCGIKFECHKKLDIDHESSKHTI